MSDNAHGHGGAATNSDLERPSKRARVLSKACETCKVKKSRCDSGRPQCETCRRKGVSCIYREKGQPGLRPGYGKALEHRLSLLEDNMGQIGHTVQEVLRHIRTQVGDNQNVPADANSAATVTEPLESHQEETVPGISGSHTEGAATGMQVPATSGTEGHDRIWPHSQQIPDSASFTSTPAQAVMQQMPLFSFTDVNRLGGDLPPEDVLRELVDLFFELVYPWAPLFYKPTFVSNIFAPENRLLLHGIVVVAFRFWKKPDPLPEVREAYVKTSRDQVLLKTVDTCTLISTQSLVLLAIDAIAQGQGPRTWNIMTMLTTAAKQLSLARSPAAIGVETNTPLVRNEDPDEGLDLSCIETQEKRRLFWVIYSLDRLSSVSHGQYGGTDTKGIRLPYPDSEDDWGQTLPVEWFQPMGQSRPSHTPQCSPWHHYVDALALLDRSNQLLIQPLDYSLRAYCQEWQSSFRRFDITISTWFENLPSAVRDPPASFDPMWVIVRSTFYLINIRMYTVAAFPSTTSPYLLPSSSARARCRQAIKDVATLSSSLQSHELDQLGPMFAFVVWVAARSLIIIWTNGYENTSGSTPIDLEPLMSTLRELSTRWQCARKYSDLIQLILDTRNDPGGPTGLEIFNDTRRTAYGLYNRLGRLTGHGNTEFDFFDVPTIPLLDVGDFAGTWNGHFGSELDGDWL